MNDQEQASQLSALFDNELPEEQADLVIRRLLKDASMRTKWSRYSLIGASLRADPLAVRTSVSDDVAARVQASLSGEPEASAASAGYLPKTELGSRSRVSRAFWGAAIAAGVAAVSLLFVRMQAPEVAPVALAETQVVPVGEGTAAVANVINSPVSQPRQIAAVSSAPPSYTTPLDNSLPSQRVSAPLVNYVLAHSEVTTSAVRFSPLTSVMNGSYDLDQDTVEMTEAEIGSHR
jgi:negative regulator of sigma E activity